MHIKRIYLILALITILAFITAWMQMQIVRQGYGISALAKCRDQAINEQKKLTVELAAAKSPQRLMAGQKVAVNAKQPSSSSSSIIIPEVITLGEFNNRVKTQTTEVKPATARKR